MIVKRFRAASMKEALELVKQELGDEAVILKSETVPRSGILDVKKKPDVEVVAAVDRQPVMKPKPNLGGASGYFAVSEEKAEPDTKAFSEMLAGVSAKASKAVQSAKRKTEKRAEPKTTAKTRRTATQAVKKAVESPQRTRAKKSSSVERTKEVLPVREPEQEKRMNVLMDEVQELRGMMHSMTSRIGHIQSEYSMREFADLPGPYAEQVMALMQVGVENNIARGLVEKAAASVPIDQVHEPGRLRHVIADQIAAKINVAGPIRCQRGEARIIVLVGPTGSGKTTTLAKLAANSKFVFNKKVALITADTHRVAALEHLNTFAGISQLPISAVYSPDELKSALIAQQDKDLIFIDTAGRSPRDEKHLLDLKRYLDMAEATEVHLVLPATLHHIDLLETLRRFSVLNFNRVVISKTDESSALGNCLNIAVESEKPLSYITTGQTIPDDIELANAQRLAQMIMRIV